MLLLFTRRGMCFSPISQVDYEFNTSTGTMDFLQGQSKENYMHNLSILLEWSPYSSEIELLNQVSPHTVLSLLTYICSYNALPIMCVYVDCEEERKFRLYLNLAFSFKPLLLVY